MIRVLIVLMCGLLAAGCASQFSVSSPEMPSPFITGQGQTQIYFNDLEASCTIDIYTMEGELVRTIDESDGNGQAEWDTRNSSGDLLESGTYQYVIKDSTGQKKGKVVIIR